MERERKSSAVALTLCVLILLPVLYLLSTGPLVYLNGRGVIADDSKVFWLYTPVELAAEYSDSFGRVLEVYLEFWAPQIYQPAPAAYRNPAPPAMPVPPPVVAAPGAPGQPVPIGSP